MPRRGHPRPKRGDLGPVLQPLLAPQHDDRSASGSSRKRLINSSRSAPVTTATGMRSPRFSASHHVLARTDASVAAPFSVRTKTCSSSISAPPDRAGPARRRVRGPERECLGTGDDGSRRRAQGRSQREPAGSARRKITPELVEPRLRISPTAGARLGQSIENGAAPRAARARPSAPKRSRGPGGRRGLALGRELRHRSGGNRPTRAPASRPRPIHVWVPMCQDQVRQ